MTKLLELFQFFASKFIAICVAIASFTYTGVKWHQNELEAVEIKVIARVEKMRDADMSSLNRRLDDIKEDVRDIKNHLINKAR
jgi:hypothetical protein